MELQESYVEQKENFQDRNWFHGLKVEVGASVTCHMCRKKIATTTTPTTNNEGSIFSSVLDQFSSSAFSLSLFLKSLRVFEENLKKDNCQGVF